jgi:hypothetical protein
MIKPFIPVTAKRDRALLLDVLDIPSPLLLGRPLNRLRLYLTSMKPYPWQRSRNTCERVLGTDMFATLLMKVDRGVSTLKPRLSPAPACATLLGCITCHDPEVLLQMTCCAGVLCFPTTKSIQADSAPGHLQVSPARPQVQGAQWVCEGT